MRVLVCGGREFANRQRFNEAQNRLRQERGIALIIAGGARGADAMAEWWAKPKACHATFTRPIGQASGAKLARSETSACSMRASQISW